MACPILASLLPILSGLATLGLFSSLSFPGLRLIGEPSWEPGISYGTIPFVPWEPTCTSCLLDPRQPQPVPCPTFPWALCIALEQGFLCLQNDVEKVVVVILDKEHRPVEKFVFEITQPPLLSIR